MAPLHRFEDLFAARVRNPAPAMYGPAPTGNLISFTYGFADPQLFPGEELLASAAAVVSENSDAALNYGPTAPELRAQVAARLRARGIAAEEPHVLITYGSSQALGLLPQVFVEPGDVVLIEGPSFLGAVRYFSDADAQLITIPVDAEGLDVDALEEQLRALGRRGVRPKFLYCIPTFQNPTGSTLSLERRRRLVALAAEHGLPVIDDDAYGELRFEGAPVPPLAALDSEGWVISLGTFSKILAPGLRLGWVCARPEVIQRLEMLKVEGSSGPFLTRTVAHYSRNGQLDAHIVELNARYRHKRDLMLEAIKQHFPAGVRVRRPEGGFFVWCDLPEGQSATALLEPAAQRGVTYLPGTRCFANGQGDGSIRLAFSYLPDAQILDGIARLGRVLSVEF
ncbi:MAG: PLP-dependent aminotransferase family protein [Roseiflexaceae bacterium]